MVQLPPYLIKLRASWAFGNSDLPSFVTSLRSKSDVWMGRAAAILIIRYSDTSVRVWSICMVLLCMQICMRGYVIHY